MKIVNPPFSEEEFWAIGNGRTPENSPVGHTLIFRGAPEGFELWKICKIGEIPFGVEVESLKEAIFATNFGAKYLFTDSLALAKKLQIYLDHYLFTTRLVVIVESLEQIEEIAQLGLDGVMEKKFYQQIWREVEGDK
jgi:nicotinate-nucleotide pyrophosphorylase